MLPTFRRYCIYVSDDADGARARAYFRDFADISGFSCFAFDFLEHY